jgi:hypothetical protein
LRAGFEDFARDVFVDDFESSRETFFSLSVFQAWEGLEN